MYKSTNQRNETCVALQMASQYLTKGIRGVTKDARIFRETYLV